MNRRSALSLAIALLAFLVSLSACNDSSGPEASIEGTWAGVVPGVDVEMTVTEGDNNAVTGSGSVTGVLDVTFTVTGTFNNPNFALTFSAPGFLPVTYVGELEDDQLDGLLNGSGFVDDRLIMIRQ